MSKNQTTKKSGVKSLFSKLVEKIKTFDYKNFARENMQSLISIAGLILCVLFFTIASGGSIWAARTVKSILKDYAPYAVLALGAVFIYSMGYMDVSLGAQLGVFGILTVYTINQTGSILLGFVLSAVIALICGLLNGTVSVFLKLPSIVTSIFLSSIFGGLQLLLVQSLTVDAEHPNGQDLIKITKEYKDVISVFKEPWMIITIIVVFAIISCFLFYYTKIGKYTKAIGANEITTAQCGVNTTLYKTLGYSVLAIAIAVAAVFLVVPKTGQISKSTGQGLAMEAMLCLILGGMPLSGGMKSKISCALIGSFIYVIINWGLNVCFSQLANYKYVINAVIFIIVVVLTSRQKGTLLPR